MSAPVCQFCASLLSLIVRFVLNSLVTEVPSRVEAEVAASPVTLLVKDTLVMHVSAKGGADPIFGGRQVHPTGFWGWRVGSHRDGASEEAQKSQCF